jgi:hypothetical protein
MKSMLKMIKKCGYHFELRGCECLSLVSSDADTALYTTGGRYPQEAIVKIKKAGNGVEFKMTWNER